MDKTWTALKIMSEWVDGVDKLNDLSPTISIFGSARLKPDDPIYQMTETLAKRLSAQGFHILTGGGPGIMEAGNKGAKAGQNGLSIGLNIELPHEQKPNDFQDIQLHFRYFLTRKALFAHATHHAYIVMPGGMGTLDELFEILTLIQTQKIKKIPIILVGSAFWGGLLEWLRAQLVSKKLIAPEDLDLLTVVDTIEGVEALVLSTKNG